jgi:tetratricopeptide (TPR) repeat protein
MEVVVRHIFVLSLFLVIVSLFSTKAYSQLDELREVTGLPFSNDQPIIYGRVTLRGLSSSEKRPNVNVALLIGGTQVDRMKADDKGYFYFLRAPRNGSVLVFELNDLEVGRQVLMVSGIRIRHDLEINWSAYQNRQQQGPGTVSGKPLYDRSAENEKLLTKGNSALAAKKYSEAIKALNQILESDPADFVAWAELGTAYFNDGKLDESDNAYTKSLQLRPGYLLALINRGKLQLARNQNENAVATFSDAVKSEPNSADAHHYLGEAYLRLKQGSKAVGPLNEAIRLAPIEMAEVHLRLAALYNAAGAKNLAANEYKLFLGKVPNHPDKDKLNKYIAENLK